MIRLKTQIQTLGFRQAQKLLRRMQLRAIKACGRRPGQAEAIYYRRTTTAQEMAHRWQAKQEAKKDELPEEYRRHWKVFDEEAAKRFPPSRIEDMKITLHPDAPRTINCKVYPLTRKEEQYVWEFLKEEEEKGYIYPGVSPIVSPTFCDQQERSWGEEDDHGLQTS
jgi:hypothetical protein